MDTQRSRIARLKEQQVDPQHERQKEQRMTSMQRTLEELKIHADINDPVVKKRYEDGQGKLIPRNEEKQWLTINHRRHEQTNLSLPRQQAMETIQASSDNAAHHTDERRPRRPSSH